MKKAKENWIGEQCGETEENLRKNKSKRTYQLVKDLTTVKQGKATTVQDRSGKCLTEERQILTALPKPSFRATRRMGDAAVGSGNRGLTI